MSSSRGIRSSTMPHSLRAFLQKLLTVQEAVLPLLRFHRLSTPELEHLVVAVVALLQRPTGA
eukprot:5315635-Heterocapsa_arctica.AAC.1